jgi:hypothetical protein
MNLRRTNKALKSSHGWSLFLLLTAAIILFAQDIFAQNYAISLRERRLGNQVGVEVWLKKLSSSAPIISNMTIAVSYNTSFLVPASPSSAPTYSLGTTDSVDYDVNQTATLPYRALTSGYNSLNGYDALAAQATNDGVNYVYQLEVKSSGALPLTTGLAAGTTGRGTFVGMLRFNITNHASLTNTTSTSIAIVSGTGLGQFSLLDATGTTITTTASLGTMTAMTVKGITILNPNGPSEALNRNKTYASLSVAGYPVYFERSGLITPAVSNEYGTNVLAYAVDYSTNNGTSWSAEVARFAETRETEAAITSANHKYLEVTTTTGTTAGYIVTRGDGTQLPVISNPGYGGIVRFIWSRDQFFAPRSEEAKLRITQLDQTGNTAAISLRGKTSTNPYDVSDSKFVLSRLFFLQLNGVNDYLRTRDNFSTSSQLTVEAWINLNSIQTTTGAEPGIVCSGPADQSVVTEGPFSLYLSQGKYPAFRVRESVGGVGRGENGGAYIATLVSPDALTATSDAIPINNNTSHSANWVHVAGVVNNNVVSLYVNGELVAKTTNSNASNIRMIQQSHPIWVAVNPNGGLLAKNYLNAGVKEVKVWRAALTAGQIRSFIAGVSTPSTVAAGDIRNALELYYDLSGSATDLATNAVQNGTNPIYYYSTATIPGVYVAIPAETYPYRPDRAHMKITSPIAGSGVSNLSTAVTPIRWAAFGIGDAATASSTDLVFEFSRDGGTQWATCIDNTTPGALLNTVDVENAQVNWMPYKSATSAGAYNDLQNVLALDANYSKTVKLRVTGTVGKGQSDITDVTGDLVVAPYFALKNTGASVIAVAPGTTMNITGSSAFLEAWIRPYRFPTTSEAYFPIINKKDSATGTVHYALRLLKSGQLQFVMTSATGTVLTANSDATKPLFEPNVQIYDSVWSHVGVFVNLANGSGQSSVKFYIDGNVQTESALTDQLGSNVAVSTTNTYPTFLAYEPGLTPATSKSFFGEMRNVRFWNGVPGGSAITGNEPTDLTNFVRGALNVRGSDLLSAYKTNLAASFDMNGGNMTANNFAYNNIFSNISSTETDSVAAVINRNVNLSYVGARPYLKLVEPTKEQLVANTTTNLNVRWVGFDFDKSSFNTGDNATATASDLQWSTFAGGNVTSYPYNATASDNDLVTLTDAFTLPLTTTYKFPGVAPPHVQFAGTLDLSKAKYNATTFVQEAVPATDNNGRLRLKTRTTINTVAAEEYTTYAPLRAESPVFTITPASNFTVRSLLEGYHLGAATAFTGTLGTTFATNGMRVTLYNSLGGLPSATVSSQISASGYSEQDPLGAVSGFVRGTAGSKFGNIPFVFTGIADGSYWVLVEHQNHLPVLSKYATPFAFTGDDLGTWAIESGWDFQGWGGTASNTLPTVGTAAGTYFTAYGYSETSAALTNYGSTGLHYNDGQASTSVAPLAAMVAGDVSRDGKIDSRDRVKVRLDAAGSTSVASDVTGDGLINATDRTIVDRNNGKYFSLSTLFPNLYASANTGGPDPGLVYTDLYTKFEATAKEFKNNSKKPAVSKADGNKVQGAGFKYLVTGETEISKDEQYISVSVYIQNKGDDFAFANVTFALNYDPNLLQYVTLTGTEGSPWSDNPNYGYNGKIYSAPTEGAIGGIPDLRTIEIDYDAYTNKTGINVPNTKTKVATLVFKIKKEANEYAFKWNKPSTVVWTVNGVNLTKDGFFDDISPINTYRNAAITSPNGGETWKVGRVYNITWTKPSQAASVKVQYSLDNGSTWSNITETAVDVMTLGYLWQVPNVNSNECLIRLVDAVSGMEIDKTDNLFSILPPANFIMTPSAKDPVYFGGNISAIKWTVEEPSKVRFEFSTDGVSNWTTVASDVNSQNGQVQWTIPTNINTKSAVIAMYDVATGQFLAASEPFRILAGNVAITSPSINEKLVGATIKKVRWNSLNVLNFDLQLSVDNGNTWESVQHNVNALKNVFDWNVKDGINSDVALVRAIYNNDPDMEYSRSAKFGIKPSATPVEGEEFTFNIDVPSPNPFTTNTNFNYSVPNDELVKVELYNTAGTKLSTLVDGMVAKGSHNVELKGTNLAAGVYYIKLTAGTNSMVQEVVLTK